MHALIAQAVEDAESHGVTKLLEDLPPPFNMVVIVVAIVFVFLTIAAIASELRKYFGHQQELALKRELVERGLHADEIETIITARPPEHASDD